LHGKEENSKVGFLSSMMQEIIDGKSLQAIFLSYFCSGRNEKERIYLRAEWAVEKFLLQTAQI
jgi:hypothetical protein